MSEIPEDASAPPIPPPPIPENPSSPPPIPANLFSPPPKQPSLFCRRLAAAAVDWLILLVFVLIGTAITGTSVFGLFVGWLSFFILWYLLTLKRDLTPGKALAGIITRFTDTGTDKSPRLLLKFAITWIPLLFLNLPVFDLGQSTKPLVMSFLQGVAILWYVALLIGVVSTQGKRGIQDSLCKSESMLTISSPLSRGRKATIWGCAVFLIIATGVPMFHLGSGATEGPGLPLESLQLAAHTVAGEFVEEDLIQDATGQWLGTTSVIARKGNKLQLITNKHVLGLEALATSDDDLDNIPEVKRYELTVYFASGKEAVVERFAGQAGSLDLALLEVDGTGLVEGTDYVVLSYDTAVQLHTGDEVVAVGSPLGLSGTHTFGRVSSLRDDNEGQQCRWIQTDAAINQGNSGGPLFVKSGSRYDWVGVNTQKVMENENLGFAIDAGHVWESKYVWYPANAQGAVEAIKQNYDRNPVVK